MNRLQLTSVTSLVMLGLAAGCSEDEKLLSERTVTPVGPEGGRALSAMGEASLDFAADALTEMHEITIETRRGDSIPRVRSAVYELGPDGLTFDAPVTLTVSVVDIELDEDEELALANVDGPYPEILDSSEWSPGDTQVSATLAHFSSYAVVTVYNPCAGKICGDSCTVCDPLDASCTEPSPVNKACNRSGLCVGQALAMCAPTPDAGVTPDAGAPMDAGSPMDAGTPVDAGTPMDSGVPVCTDTFVQNPQPIVDILLVIDNSGSMTDEQASLAASFSLLRTTLTDNNVDFHIGVTNTDVSASGPRGALLGSPAILTSSTANLPTAFANNVMVGNMGNPIEAGLEASQLALAAGANPGFLRGTGSTTVIYVSDEDDQSSSSTTAYTQFLLGLGGPRRVQVNTIVGDVPGGCQGTGGPAAAGTRYEAVRQALGGAFSSICDSTWGQALTDLGGPGFGYLFEFPLASPATGVQTVTVDGVPVPASDWSYDPVTHSVVFDAQAVPGPSASIEVISDC